MESGKLFVGGISWETNEEHLREHFRVFSEIEDVVVMRDRGTGRSRGFGFIVFADPSVAEKVVREKHVINGRTVEAKKAVPRDDLQNSNKNIGSLQGSPDLACMKKIFVGGLAPTVMESDLKKYFVQFGTVIDVVVIYDHNTQRPRGFGFITYDSEEAVDKVLIKTFHELKGKMVEVKRAVPKLLSPGPTRSPSSGYPYGMNKVGGSPNAYAQGYLLNPASMRMDGRFSPVTTGRNVYPPYGPGDHAIKSNLEPGFGLNYAPVGRDSNFRFRLGMNSSSSVNSSRYGSPVPYDMDCGGNASILSPANQNVWGNWNLTNSLNPNEFFTLGSDKASGIVDGFGSIAKIWGLPSVSDKGRTDGFGRNIDSGHGGESIGGRGGYVRNNAGLVRTTLYDFTNNVHDRGFGNYSLYSNHAWLPSSPELEDFASFGNVSGSNAIVAAHVTRNHSVVARRSPGIAA